MMCSGSSRAVVCWRHLVASKVRIGQTDASATAATWASHVSSPVFAITAASLAAWSASRKGATRVFSSLSRPRSATSPSSVRESSDAAVMASTGMTSGCLRPSRARTRRVTSASERATATRTLTSSTYGVGLAPLSSVSLHELFGVSDETRVHRNGQACLPVAHNRIIRRRYPDDGTACRWGIALLPREGAAFLLRSPSSIEQDLSPAACW